MGFFSRKSESMNVDELAAMSDRDRTKAINEMVKTGKIPEKTAKQLKKEAKDLERRVSGEKGLGAIGAALKGGGTGNRNHDNIPLKERVHPAEYQRILHREAKKQGLI